MLTDELIPKCPYCKEELLRKTKEHSYFCECKKTTLKETWTVIVCSHCKREFNMLDNRLYKCPYCGNHGVKETTTRSREGLFNITVCSTCGSKK